MAAEIDRYDAVVCWRFSEPLALQMGVISVRLNDKLQARLATLSERMRRPCEEIINEALEQFVAREELQATRLRQSLQAHAEAESGDVVEGDEMVAWIKSWGTENELPPPRR